MSWRGIVTALDSAARFRSRIALYHHPLAGRPLLWHVLTALARMDAAPVSITLLHRSDTTPILPPDPHIPIALQAVETGEEMQAIRRAVGQGGMALLIDARTPLVEPASLLRLLRAAEDGVAALGDARQAGAPAAIAGEGLALGALDDPRHPDEVAVLAPVNEEELLRIDDRATFSKAGERLRNRLVRLHQEQGVSFVLPETTWIDVDVTIGADTLLYPGVLLEGMTEIGSECVIGPHCRVIESRIGRGVELKGWNYVTHTSIRNHAVLEPYVRRGYE
jgi:bifunctional N-acetylglucosamine-1-phosphate-uridyltransferase/glucosamine-1-phosphate-acetyltransferase GlmU-like protein